MRTGRLVDAIDIGEDLGDGGEGGEGDLLADAYRHAADVMVENMLARDAEEGIGAFIEKRTPSWEDR